MNISTEPSMQQILEVIPLGIGVFNRKRQVVALNTLLAKVIGISGEEVAGRDILELFQEGGVPQDHPIVLALKEGGNYTGPVTPITSRFPSYFSTHFVKDEDGGIAGGLVILWDARRQQELENAVLRAERLAIMGQLAAAAMHEIRNPLSSVQGILQLLRREVRGARFQNYLEIMLNALDRVNSLLTDYLRLAKPGIPRREPCDLKELMAEVAALVENEISGKGIRFISSPAADLPPVALDREQFHQVLFNVLKNALEATPAGGEIRMEASVDAGQGAARITVRDTGPGIAEEVLQQVFDPFFTTKEKGTGLGLYVCRSIVENHGGEIRIGNNPDRGCAVEIILPYE